MGIIVFFYTFDVSYLQVLKWFVFRSSSAQIVPWDIYVVLVKYYKDWRAHREGGGKWGNGAVINKMRDIGMWIAPFV